ncbi:CHY zinc finger protein [Lentibacillus salinarum]|uniref:CHY zinc finger protein n=1 Tax=Lentibacillus salinarum TaxID=446820 RepID=A0ABW3ZVR2_9BACI
MKIIGAIDDETRCEHYHSPNDRIAIKFKCCGAYFSCYQCHAQYGCGQVKVWPRDKFHDQAILCGHCKATLSINDYLASGYSCPSCDAAFNPGCALHSHLYFAKK